MFRRFFRIFCVVGFVVLVGTAVVSQFWAFVLRTPIGSFALGPVGVGFEAGNATQWQALCYREPTWIMDNLLAPPHFVIPHSFELEILPWWLFLAAWGLLTALIWRLTRRRKVSQGFPIEPTAKSP